jgi:pimeloyl-ACP methyl ester carboxylesterase
MASKFFNITEHKVPCQHIREYPQGTSGSQNEVLYLHVKQYTPLNNTDPQPGDVTIIGAHANGFPKELYEPLWEEILNKSKAAGFGIRGIWIADVAQEGQSSVINEKTLGINQSWFDHPRDLLHMINYFRESMPRPLVGVGHSMGGAQLVQLSLLHPRILESIILLDPIIRSSLFAPKFSPAFASARRRDLWPSREVAAESFKKSGFYKPWDPRVLERWIKYGLRDLPTAVFPEVKTIGQDKEVTLTTTRLHEVFSFGKEVLPLEPAAGFTEKEWQTLHEMMDADYDPRVIDRGPGPMQRPEPAKVYQGLTFLRPSVLWVRGELSPLSPEDETNEKAAVTGTGLGGSGGAAKGRSKAIAIKGTGHLIPMEKVEDTADAITAWLGPELERWRNNDTLYTRYWATVPPHDRHTLGEGFQAKLKTLLAKI